MIEKEKVDDDNNESLVLLPPEEGANIKPPATPLGKKVMSEGREEGPNEGETWRLATSRSRAQCTFFTTTKTCFAFCVA